MIRFRKCVVVLTMLAAFCFAVLSVSARDAEGKYDYSVSTQYDDLAVGDRFTVRISVYNIKEAHGISLVTSKVYYDPSCLELAEWTIHVPDEWAGGEDAEKFEAVKEDKGGTYFLNAIMNVNAFEGVKDDDQLYTDLTFQVLNDEVDGSAVQVRECWAMSGDNRLLKADEQALTLRLGASMHGEVASLNVWKYVIAGGVAVLVVAAGILIYIFYRKRGRAVE